MRRQAFAFLFDDRGGRVVDEAAVAQLAFGLAQFGLLAPELAVQPREFLVDVDQALERDEHLEFADQRDRAARGAVIPPEPDDIGAARFYTVISNFMGVSLADTGLQLPTDDSAASAANPSPEVRACQALFHDLLLRASELAGVSGNLYRLLAEYRLTERRARALENVILPEIEQSLKVMTTHLEELEFEDAVRVRRQAGI